MGSSARGLVRTRIRSRTGPGGRSSARPGRLGQRVTGCSACGVPSALLSTSRPPRLACSNRSVRPALYSRQSKVSSQVRRCLPLPAAPGSGRTVNSVDSSLRTAAREKSSPSAVSAMNSRRPPVITWRPPSGNATARPPETFVYLHCWVLSESLSAGPVQSGGGEDVRRARHAGLGARPGDGGGARGRGRADGFGRRDTRGQGDGERADERVPGTHGVHRVDPKGADGAGSAGPGVGSAVRARGDHGVPGARGEEGSGGLTRFGQATHRPAEDGARLGLVYH